MSLTAIRLRPPPCGGKADYSEKDASGNYIKNRSGLFLCPAYSDGKCKSRATDGKCAATGKAHQCYKCLNTHKPEDCPLLKKKKTKGGGKGGARGGRRR